MGDEYLKATKAVWHIFGIVSHLSDLYVSLYTKEIDFCLVGHKHFPTSRLCLASIYLKTVFLHLYVVNCTQFTFFSFCC